MAYVKYIIFALGSQKYGMKLARVNGLEPLYNIVPVPLGAQYIKGIIHLRGDIVPIYDLKEHFKIPYTGTTETSQLLVTESHGIKIGFEVDDVLGIVAISEEETRVLPGVVQNENTGFLDSVINVLLPEHNELEIMLSIDVDKLMTDSEFRDVKEALEKQEEDEKSE